MLTAFLTGIAFLVGAFAERIVFAVMILLIARSVAKALRRLKQKAVALLLPIAMKATMAWRRFKNRVRFVFGPTIRVSC